MATRFLTTSDANHHEFKIIFKNILPIILILIFASDLRIGVKEKMRRVYLDT